MPPRKLTPPPPGLIKPWLSAEVMTPEEIQGCLDAARLSVRAAAERMGCADNTIRNWLAGALVPTNAARWLRTLAADVMAADEKNPPPVWRNKAA